MTVIDIARLANYVLARRVPIQLNKRPPRSSGARVTSVPQTEITQLLRQWQQGDSEALETLMPKVYSELKRLAGSYLRRERPDHTLQSAALVNEAYLRMVDQHQTYWQNKAHFFGIAAQMMRRILADYARSHNAAKRGAGVPVLELDEALAEAQTRSVDLMDLDEALQKLEKLDPQQGRIVELRFFGGLSIEDTANVLSISPATVKRDWAAARAWLFREIGARRAVES